MAEEMKKKIVLLLIITVIMVGIRVVESECIEYNTSQRMINNGKINVHLVPHSHDDVGWLKTVDQYYVGANNSIRGACVQNVLDSVISALLEDKNRKFIYVEMAFFQRWWRQQSKALKTKVQELVNSGQLEFINGGMCMHDEATPHYIDLIDQTTLGHQFIKKEFGQEPRVGWQIDPFGHSAVQAYLLGAELGFDSLFFARIDYQDRAKRKDDKTLEVVWQGSKSLASSSQIFTGIFPRHYDPPDGFTFEINDVSPPIQDDILLFDYNVEERVDDFIAAAVAQANVTRTNHIMWLMGTDFRYQYANSWFRQMDKFIHYVNLDGRVNALYSTPSLYTDSKFATDELWPLKTGDFFPYADHENAYWTGYFTSRPAFKGYVRMMSGYYLAARQLEYFKGRSSSGSNTDALADALAIAQHHDAVSGTERQHVAADYAKRLSMGYAEAEKVVTSSLALLVESKLSTRHEDSVTQFQQCPLLNVSYCPPSEAALSNGKSLVIVVYNPLGWKREEAIQIPVPTEVIVLDSAGREIESQLLPLSNASLRIRNFHVKAYLDRSPGDTLKYWLAFSVSVPPLGFSTYIVSSAKRTEVGSSTISEVYTSEGSTDFTVEVGQGNLKLLYNANEGKLTHYINGRSLVRTSAAQSYSYYYAYNGTDKDSQASGAYIFRPNGTFPIKSEGQVSLTVMRGSLVDEVHQQLNPWIYQVTRVYKGKEHAEVEFIDLVTRRTIGSGSAENGLYFLDQPDKLAHSSTMRPTTTDDIWLWHRRLGHPSFYLLKHLFPSIFSNNNVSEFLCESCQLGKQHRASFAPSFNKSLVPFSLIHFDVWDSSRVVFVKGHRWFVTFIDDFSRTTWVYLMKDKSEVFFVFQNFHRMICTQFGATVKIFCSDNGGEYIYSGLGQYFSTHGIIHQTSCTNTPQQNGVAERKNCHLLDMARCMCFSMSMPRSYWGSVLKGSRRTEAIRCPGA